MSDFGVVSASMTMGLRVAVYEHDVETDSDIGEGGLPGVVELFAQMAERHPNIRRWLVEAGPIGNHVISQSEKVRSLSARLGLFVELVR